MEIGMDGKGFHLSFVVVYISNIYIYIIYCIQYKTIYTIIQYNVIIVII